MLDIEEVLCSMHWFATKIGSKLTAEKHMADHLEITKLNSSNSTAIFNLEHKAAKLALTLKVRDGILCLSQNHKSIMNVCELMNVEVGE